ncbi:hypothetical protein MUN81_21400 [Hymenobacter sp. 5317J-9]|uniref:hypothetical protein n=1 Tax=Hymenobacter sp. 5317J-9 TaxID=2932250 RepID=UPI001FD6D721|nr:hypothetical protein [Hymenobacter sp. 5317J-9]UOQ97770.1 hypothetical protein MUN81_21400 [Hymenobacter sp. 5317J-9]
MALLLYLAIPYGSRLFFPRVVIGYDTAVDARVTGHMQSRRFHSFFFNNQTDNQYDVSDFVAATPANAGPGTDSEDQPDLGEYLKHGDYIHKEAHSTTLTVRRGNNVTRWVCPLPKK